MGNEQKQRALQILRRFERAVPMTRQSDNAAVAMATMLQELIDAPEQAASVPDVTRISDDRIKQIAADAGMEYICDGVWRALPCALRSLIHRTMMAAAPEAPAVQSSNWCAGCTPDDCPGCERYNERPTNVAAEMAAITPAVQANLVKDAERVFIKKIAEQTPEKPDYWSECGQCSYNISEAQDLIDAAIAAEKGNKNG